MKSFTFKKGPRPTGRQAIVHRYPTTDIKLGGKLCGTIAYDPNWAGSPRGTNKWKVRLMVKEGTSFKWVTFQTVHDTETLARVWLKFNGARLQQAHQIHLNSE